MSAMASCLLSVTLLTVCAVVAADPGIDNDQRMILDFMSVMSGSWSNKAQIEAGSRQHDLIEGYIQPVEMPALGYKHVLLAEQSVNGRVAVLNVVEVKVDKKNKNMIRLVPYEFTDPRKYKPREFKADDLRNITRSQLKSDPDCVDYLVRLSETVFSAICAICRSIVGGKHPGYAVTFTCDECIGAIPLSVPAKSSAVPYVFRLDGPKFPLIDPPANYISPCDKKLGSSTNSTQG